jgi:HD-like signal output (HDOD) protein/nitrogen-specific signal transduction histidine kinase
MEEIVRSRILQKIAGGDCLPSPSPVVSQLLQMASDESASLWDLAHIIEQDAGLTTRLLKLVNTAFYAHRREVSSISQAILIIGFKKLRMMALSMSLRDAFPFGRVGGMDYEYFWKNSLYRALIAQGFARLTPALSGLVQEEVFTAGLIQEIGMLMLFHVCPAAVKDAFPGGNVPLEEVIAWEEQHLGINHREVSRLVLKRWHFPVQIIESQQHFGADALQPDRSPLCTLLEVARACAQLFCGTQSDFELIKEMADPLGLGESEVNEILCGTFSKVEQIAEQLRLEVNSNRDILEIMEKANRTLSRINGSLEDNLGKILELMATKEHLEPHASEAILQERKRALENVLDAVAHEIRNPLMAIGGFAQRLTNSVEGQSGLQKYADIIVQESGRLERVLNDVVAFAQVYKPLLAESNLISVLDRAIDDLQALVAQKRIQVLRNYQRDPLYLLLDQEAFTKALQHLLESVIQLITQRDGKIWVEVSPQHAAQQTRIVIGSRGGTISEEVRNILLGLDFSSRPFVAGLGLLLSWKVLEAHHSRIELQTQDETNNLVIHLPLRT